MWNRKRKFNLHDIEYHENIDAQGEVWIENQKLDGDPFDDRNNQ